MVMTSWCFAIFISILPVFGWSSYVMEPGNFYSGLDWSQNTESLSYILFILTVGFLLPQLFIFISNLLFWKKVSIIKNYNHKRSLKLFIIISMLCFDICWGPYAVCGILRLLTKIEISFVVICILGGLTKLLGVIDVIILIVLKRECRKMVLRLLGTLFNFSYSQKGKEFSSSVFVKYHCPESSTVQEIRVECD